MALRDLTDRSAVLEAMAEFDRIGRDAFLRKYGFDRSRRFVLEHEGEYDSKATLAAAHGIQFPEAGPLGPHDFSGGRETTAKAAELGFSVRDLGSRVDDLGLALSRFMERFAETPGATFGGSHPAVQALQACATAMEPLVPPALAGARVRPSAGQGNWAAVPWIAVLHPQVTTTTQHGTYPVLLFDEDKRSVEVTIAQGVTDLKKNLGRREAVRELERQSERLRPLLQGLSVRGFLADNDFGLGTSPLARDYVASTVVHKRHQIDDLASSSVSEDVAAVLEAYSGLLTSGALRGLEGESASSADGRALMIYVGHGADANFESGGREGWWGWKDAPERLERLRPGDLVAFGRGFQGGSPRVDAAIWQASGLNEVVVGRVLQTPERTDQAVMPDELAGTAAYPWKFRFERLGTERAVSLESGKALSKEAGEALRKSALTRGIGILAPVAGSRLLEGFVNPDVERPSPGPDRVAAAASAFSLAVDGSGLRLGESEIIAFFGALMTKPFAILTGQSGSGKTQLAKRLGEWFGVDSVGRPRYLVVPVRPDWTGPEYLFGYSDALRSVEGKEVWAVPDALEFMLRAASEPDAPYLLILDEMNLAHVERYFADFLSGVESREPVLPELKSDNGSWLATGNSQRLPIPRNLFVAGTVNVDETTYLFSPKVLDRAFTFEFRTAAADLDPTLRWPTSVAEAPAEQLDVVVRVARDDEWQHAHPHPAVDVLVDDLRNLHGLLAPSGHDFGHRVFYDSLRYSALLAAMGVTDRWTVLDRIVLTKILPKLHGTRSRLEKTLRSLLAFAEGDGPSPEYEPRLPLTATKLDRMITVLVEAQFVSFTE